MTSSTGQAIGRPVPERRRRLRAERHGCTTAYSPFTVTYPATSGCGNAIVHSSEHYSGQLTIAAENDMIIDGNITAPASSSADLLGLVANNFIRIKHPICRLDNPGCTTDARRSETAKGQCNSGVNGNRRRADRTSTIDAAMLAIDHSFIVDHYDCGGKPRNADRERRDRAEVPRRGRDTTRRHRLHQELQLRRPPALPGAAALLRPGAVGLARPAGDAGRRSRARRWRHVPDRLTRLRRRHGDRQLRRRGRPPPPPGQVDRRAEVHVRLLRRADRGLRQRPGPLLAHPARTLPQLRRADPGCAIRSSSSRWARRSRRPRSSCTTIRPSSRSGSCSSRCSRRSPSPTSSGRSFPIRSCWPARSRAGARRRDRPREPAGAGDRRRRRRRPAAGHRPRLSARHGDGRRQAGGGDGPLPGQRRRARAVRRGAAAARSSESA